MSDLYPILLREEKNLQFGANLPQILQLDKRGIVMDAHELTIKIDGDTFKPLTCSNINITTQANIMVIDITTVPQTDETAPISSIVVEEKGKFDLVGDDLESFLLLSGFRLDENKINELGKLNPITKTLESDEYNIQDLPSIQNATLELVGEEQQYLDDGYKVYQVQNPKFEYQDAQHFKLVETVVLCKLEAIKEE